jgi:hypothetical protein
VVVWLVELGVVMAIAVVVEVWLVVLGCGWWWLNEAKIRFWSHSLPGPASSASGPVRQMTLWCV